MSLTRHRSFTALSCKQVTLATMHNSQDPLLRDASRSNFVPVGDSPERALVMLGAVLLVSGALAQATGASDSWMRALHAGEPVLHLAWAGLTLLGFGWPLLIFSAVYAGRRGVMAAVFLKAALIAIVLTQLPKALWPYPRPAAVLDESQMSIVGDAVVHTASMPSGHALAVFAMVAAAWLGWARCGVRVPATRTALAWGVVLGLAAAVAWSRVAVGAHWPADVLVGAGGGLWAGALAWRWEWRWPWGAWFSSRRGHQVVCAFLVLSALAWALTKTGYPQVSWLQSLIAVLAVIEACRRCWRLTAERGRAEQSLIEGSRP